jgi:outer membrane protein OmpA-like peptidoglycan-associated protein
MGCAAVPDTQTIHDETEQSLTLGITQVRGTPDHFLICADCPASTQKTAISRSVQRAQSHPGNDSQHAPRKLTIRFDHASSVLSDSDRVALAQLVNTLPEAYRITITGYTDNTATGGTITNDTLAQQRARSVMDYLIGLGVDKNSIASKVSPRCCYIDSNTTDSGRAKNRRTEILVTSRSTPRYKQEEINP